MVRRITHFQRKHLARVVHFVDADGWALQRHVADTPDRNCANVPVERFFPATDEYYSAEKKEAEQAEIESECRGCPVADQCLTGALLRGERFGSWGGVAQPRFQELGRIFRAQQRKRAESAEAA